MNSHANKMSSYGLAYFGLLVGVLTSLSEATGTATTLIGFLFAMIGGSLLVLFDKTKHSERETKSTLEAIGQVSLFAIVGLGSGFLLRGVDRGFFQPALSRLELESQIAREKLIESSKLESNSKSSIRAQMAGSAIGSNVLLQEDIEAQDQRINSLYKALENLDSPTRATSDLAEALRALGLALTPNKRSALEADLPQLRIAEFNAIFEDDLGGSTNE